MICEKCGEVCQCPMEPLSPPLPVSNSVTATETEASLPNSESSAGSDNAWRHEHSARLNTYRSRRKSPPPRYPSLRLPFSPAASALKTPPLEESLSTHAFESARNHAFAPDESEDEPSKAEEPMLVTHSTVPATLQSAQ